MFLRVDKLQAELPIPKAPNPNAGDASFYARRRRGDDGSRAYGPREADSCPEADSDLSGGASQAAVWSDIRSVVQGNIVRLSSRRP
jgi:hypothetical protein